MKRPGTAAVVSVPGAGSAVGDVGHRPTTAAGQRPTIRLSTWDQEQFINIQRTLKFVSEGEILLSTPTRLKKPKEPDPEPGEAATPNQPDPVHEIRQRLPIVPVKNELRRSRTMGRIRNKNAQRHLMACLTEEGRPKPGALKRCSSSVTFLPRHELHDANFYRYQGESSWNNIWRVPKERLKYVASQKKNQCTQTVSRVELSPRADGVVVQTPLRASRPRSGKNLTKTKSRCACAKSVMTRSWRHSAFSD